MGVESKRCPGCQAEFFEGPPNCPKCGWDLAQAAPPDIIYLEPLPDAPAPPTVVVSPAPRPPVAPAAPPPPPSGGRPHSAAVALACALLVPGAGQAYNGRPVRGFFVLFLTPLVVPWLLSLWGAWSTASRMRAEGGRFGAGGFVWVFLQLWLFCNVGLATLLGLTLAGVVR